MFWRRMEEVQSVTHASRSWALLYVCVGDFTSADAALPQENPLFWRRREMSAHTKSSSRMLHCQMIDIFSIFAGAFLDIL